jgi:hypothetical protein
MDEKKQILLLETELQRFQRELKDCANELCYKCGSYKREHEGACDGCRWKPIRHGDWSDLM